MAKTQREEQNEVARAVAPLLKLLSPYSVYEPYEDMDYRVSKPTILKTVQEIEKLTLEGKFDASDMFILKAIDCLGYCYAPSVRALLRFMKARDTADAAKKGRPGLIIPDFEDHSAFWDRLMYLCGKGLVVRHKFMPNPDWANDEPSEENGKNLKPYKYFYHLTGIAATMYKTRLQDFRIQYNPASQMLPEVETFRQVSASVLTGAMLQSPFVTDVKFNYKKQIQNGYKKEGISVLATFLVNMDGEAGNPNASTRLIIDSITLNTNQNTQTSESRLEWLRKRLGELSRLFKEFSKENMTRILMVVENFQTLSHIRDEVFSIDPSMLPYILFTTGSVLEKHKVVDHPAMLQKSFIEFPLGNSGVPDKRPTGAVGYYFLHFGNEVKL